MLKPMNCSSQAHFRPVWNLSEDWVLNEFSNSHFYLLMQQTGKSAVYYKPGKKTPNQQTAAIEQQIFSAGNK